MATTALSEHLSRMTASGYKQTSGRSKSTSALPPKADVRDRTSAFSSATPPDAQDCGVVGPDDLNDIRCRDGFSGLVAWVSPVTPRFTPLQIFVAIC